MPTTTTRYVRMLSVPKTVSAGRVLVHNDVLHGPNWGCGQNGFRAWTDTKPPPGFVLCPCGYAGLKHYAARKFVRHYRQNPARYKRKVRAMERSMLTRFGL
jgi:hypothetical protein